MATNKSGKERKKMEGMQVEKRILAVIMYLAENASNCGWIESYSVIK